MNAEDRRAFLQALGAFGLTPLAGQPGASAQPLAKPGYVLNPDEGEHLVHFRDGGDICIKTSATTGARDFAMGTQQVKVGTGIPEHRHPAMDESFYVLQGRGTVRLGEVRHTFEAGATIFIPRTTWHAFENPEQALLLLWFVSPPGLESFFRGTCSPPGQPPKGLTPAQIRAVALEYGTEFR